jgi:putative copper export protein
VSPDSAAALAAAARWIGFLSTLIAVGACTYRYGVLRSLPADIPVIRHDTVRRAADLGLYAGALLAAALLLKLYAQARSFLEPEEPLTRELLDTILGETAWGRGWLAQLIASGLTVIGFALARMRPRPGWIMALLGVSAVILATPLTGHAVATDRAGAWGYPLDALHVLAGGSWLGTLAVLVAAGLPATRRVGGGPDLRALAALINAFSPIALLSAGVATLAGGVLGFQYLEGSLSALFATPYGRMLSLKIGTLVGVAALGAFNWRVLRPRLAPSESAAAIRRSSLAELALGGILLAVTAVLVALPMPGTE